jgi:hypothetical protein
MPPYFDHTPPLLLFRQTDQRRQGRERRRDAGNTLRGIINVHPMLADPVERLLLKHPIE